MSEGKACAEAIRAHMAQDIADFARSLQTGIDLSTRDLMGGEAHDAVLSLDIRTADQTHKVFEICFRGVTDLTVKGITERNG